MPGEASDCAAASRVGDRLRRQPVVASKGGELRTTLRVEATRLCVGGVAFDTRTYNGIFPGPTLLVRPGDRVHVELSNHLGPNAPDSGTSAPQSTLRAPNSTNLHVHGLYQTAARDNTFVSVEPGGTRMYSYLVHPATGSSTLWYHPHLDGSSAMQVAGGMAGAFIVAAEEGEGGEGGGGGPFRGWDEHLLLIQSIDLDRSSTGFLPSELSNDGTSSLDHDVEGLGGGGADGGGTDGLILVVNGQLAPTVPLAAGALSRLRLVNALVGVGSGTIIARIARHDGEEGASVLPPPPAGAAAEGCSLCVLGYDGVFLRAPRCQPSLMLPPGGRADVALTCQRAGRYALATADSELGLAGLFPPRHILLTVDVGEGGGGAPTPIPSSLPGPPPYYPELRRAPAAREADRFSFVFSNHLGENVVNGAAYDGRSVAHVARLGSVQEWTVFGQPLRPPQASSSPPAPPAGGACCPHPYHQHVTHFQVVSASLETGGLAMAAGDYRDTVPLYPSLNFTLRFVASLPGLQLVHCHNLRHEDLGMMALVDVRGADAERVTPAPAAAIALGGGERGIGGLASGGPRLVAMAVFVLAAAALALTMLLRSPRRARRRSRGGAAYAAPSAPASGEDEDEDGGCAYSLLGT